MKKIYLCGPINGCTDAECMDWRAHVKSIWPTTIDPMSRDYRGRESECLREIVELDKRDIQSSAALIVNYDRPSVGTSMEIIFAWQLGKPVVLVCKKGEKLSPWLVYHCTAVRHSFADALAWLEYALSEGV